MQEKELHNRIASVESKLDLLLSLFQNGSFDVQNKPFALCAYTLYSWLDEWYTTYKAPKLKPNSLREISICINNHIKPHIDDKPLNQITGLDIQKALNKVKASRTKKYTYNVYNGAFKQATKLQLIPANIMQSVESVQHKYKNGKALSREQQAQFYTIIANNKLKPLYEFYLLSGCRRGEGIDLKWTDIDFNNKLIHIHGTKTETSNRTIPLFTDIETLLLKLPRVSDKVFNCTANTIQCNFKRMKTKHKLTFRIHDLRHTFATRCLEKGISMKTIQKWLGHSRLETTSNIYTHVQTDFEREEIAKYNNDVKH